MAGGENYPTIKSLFQSVVNDGARPLMQIVMPESGGRCFDFRQTCRSGASISSSTHDFNITKQGTPPPQKTSGRRKSKNFAASKSNITVAKQIKGGKRVAVVEDDYYLRLLRRVPAKID